MLIFGLNKRWHFNDTVQSQLLNNGVWLTEEKLENPNWTRCLETFDNVIEKTIAWGYPYIAAASARIKAITHDEKLNDPDTAHKVLQDITSKLGPLPTIEEAQAVVYFNRKRYKDALDIYERILPKWNPPSDQVNIGPLEEYRRAAICAASLNDWKKAATFLEEGAKRTQKIENTERYISLYADAGFSHFKAGNILDCLKMLNLVLQKFETLPKNNTDIKYSTLKKRLMYAIGWMNVSGGKNSPSELAEPPIGFCSDPSTNEKFLTSPDFPIGFSWLNLALIEYKFGHGTAILEHVLQSSDRDAHPTLNYFISVFELQHDFRNKTFDDLPQRIYQLVNARNSMEEHNQSDEGIAEHGVNPIPTADLPNLDSVENITALLVASLLVQLSTNVDTSKFLVIWRTNSSELPIKENIFTTLDLIESTLLEDPNHALAAMKTPDTKVEKRLAAALKLIQNKEVSPKDLFYAHTFITTFFIGKTWEGFVATDLAKLISAQWLGKKMEIPIRAVSKVEQACNNSETGKKKIGQILLAAHQAVSTKVAPDILQQLRSWTNNTR